VGEGIRKRVLWDIISQTLFSVVLNTKKKQKKTGKKKKKTQSRGKIIRGGKVQYLDKNNTRKVGKKKNC